MHTPSKNSKRDSRTIGAFLNQSVYSHSALKSSSQSNHGRADHTASWTANSSKVLGCLHDPLHGRLTGATALSSKAAPIETTGVPEQAQSLGYLSLGQNPCSASRFRSNSQKAAKMAITAKQRRPTVQRASSTSFNMF
jgi:hypothetical protein